MIYVNIEIVVFECVQANVGREVVSRIDHAGQTIHKRRPCQLLVQDRTETKTTTITQAKHRLLHSGFLGATN
jgi:hypothetical protein